LQRTSTPIVPFIISTLLKSRLGRLLFFFFSTQWLVFFYWHDYTW
jgi:hypothetical protein